MEFTILTIFAIAVAIVAAIALRVGAPALTHLSVGNPPFEDAGRRLGTRACR